MVLDKLLQAQSALHKFRDRVADCRPQPEAARALVERVQSALDRIGTRVSSLCGGWWIPMQHPQV